MGTLNDVVYTVEGTVARLTLARPERLNALDFALVDEVKRCIAEAAADDAVRSLVVRGQGRAFCAGDNLKGMGETPHGMDPLLRMREAGYVAIVRALRSLDKPVLTAAQGYAMGAGLEVFMAGDIRLATEDARLGIPFIKLGLAGGTYQLPRLIGLTKAAAMLFTGEPISGTEAERIGLVTETAENEEAMEQRIGWWTDLLAERATSSIGLMKRALYRCYEMPYDQATELSVLNFATATLNGERAKGVGAWRSARGIASPAG